MRDIHESYDLIGKTGLGDIHSVGYVLRHRKSGAKICLIENDDENKVFYVGFRTPPLDSTGAAHICEHSVLCGSRKYPVKDPFVELVKGSLNTFLNAMTYPDKTVYPVASCNDVDFKNLMDVYMDAVFYPNIYDHEEIFRQEGWHYEMEDKDSPLTINGVVYNEMKGAFSSPDDVLSREILNSLYPDNAYQYESGGDPKVVPTLTYETFLDFHRRYYHPVNSFIYLYGNMDMNERLDYLDKEYLSKFDAIELDSHIEKQEAFAEPKEITKEYSISADDEEENQTYLSINYSLATVLNPELYQAFDILDYALLNAPGSPLQKALFDAGIGVDIQGGYDSGIYQPYFSIIAKGANTKDKGRFLSIVRGTLEEQVKNGIDRRALLAAIKSAQFKFREADFGQFPKGLIYGLNLMDSWLYDETQPFMHLQAIEVLDDLKKKVDTGYFEDLVKTYFLENNHSTILTLEPKKGLTGEEEKALESALAKYKEDLSDKEIDDIVAFTKHLKAYQDEPSSPEDLAKIPMLKREDLKREIRPISNNEYIYHDVHLVHHDIYTNGIHYLNLCFDASGIKEENLSALSFYTKILGLVDNEKYDYASFANEVNLVTGGLTNSLSIYPTEDGEFKFVNQVQIRYLYEDAAEAMDLLKQMIFHSKLDDHKRLLELLQQEKSQVLVRINSTGNASASLRCSSYYSKGAKVTDDISGIAYYEFLKDFEEHFEEKVDDFVKLCWEMQRRIFRKENLTVSATGDGQALALSKLEIPSILEELYTKEFPEEHLEVHCTNKNEAFKTPAQIQYVARSGDFKLAGYEYSGAMKILKTALSYDYFWINVRVKGGAYGCHGAFARTGIMHFSSYRDPNLRETNEVFEGTDAYVKNFDVDERDMTKYIIGTVSGMDTPLTPYQKGVRSFTLYMTGLSAARLQKERDEVIDATVESVRALAPAIRGALDQGWICVIGNENTIEENKELFDKVVSLS